MNICKLEHHFFEGKRVPKHAGADFSQAGSLRADGGQSREEEIRPWQLLVQSPTKQEVKLWSWRKNVNLWIQLRLLCLELLTVMASPQECVQTSWFSEVKWGSVCDARCRTSWIESIGFVNWMFTKSHLSRDVNCFAALKTICFCRSWYRSIDVVICTYRSIDFGLDCVNTGQYLHIPVYF